MGVKLVSAGGGSVEINPPATASNFIATMPAGAGNVVVNGVNGALVLGTAQNSTSGTSIDFTGIPSWVRQITVMFSGVSTNGTSPKLIQIGSGSVSSTGYVSSSAYYNTSGTFACAQFTAGFGVNSVQAVDNIHGTVTLSLINSATNTWGVSGTLAGSSAAVALISCGGGVALSGVLDRVRITTVNGTDTFDAGSINIMYE